MIIKHLLKIPPFNENKSKSISGKLFVCMCLSLLLSGKISAQPDPGYGILDQLISSMLKNNPGLRAEYQKVLSDSASISAAGSLPDPVISFNLLNLPVNSFRFDQEPMSGKQIALKQQVPFFGTLDLKQHIGADKAQMTRQNYLEYRNQRIRDLKTLVYELQYTASGIRISAEKEALMKRFVDIITTKYATGRGLQQDVLRAQVELAKIIEESISFKQKKAELEAKLNALLNRKPTETVQIPDRLNPAPVVLNTDSLFQIALNNRPLIKRRQIESIRRDREIKLATKSYYPSMSLFAAYTQRDELQNGGKGVDFLSAGISLTIPLYAGNKQGAEVDNRTAIWEGSNFQYINDKRQLRADIESTVSDLRYEKELLQLYHSGILPQSQQSLESAMIGYQTDKIDFDTLLNNYLTLYKYELMTQKITRNYLKNLAKLEFLTGKFTHRK